jgi:hypothetical protein
MRTNSNNPYDLIDNNSAVHSNKGGDDEDGDNFSVFSFNILNEGEHLNHNNNPHNRTP